MANFIGVDLGTTFSAVGHLDDTGRPVIVRNRDGENITPSVVSFSSDDLVHVGESARKTLGIDPNTRGRFKRDMGTSTRYELRGKEYSPTVLSSLVLKKLREETEASIGQAHGAIVTIPANFANEAREATMEAARLAGLEVKHIINEPTAAALFYAYEADESLGGVYAVYDLGGGTFDVSIINLSDQDVELLATDGVSRLGGDDFDEAVRKLVAEKYRDQTGGELDPTDFTKFLREFQSAAEAVDSVGSDSLQFLSEWQNDELLPRLMQVVRIVLGEIMPDYAAGGTGRMVADVFVEVRNALYNR